MSKWQEDLLYEITMSVKEKGIRKEFDRQLKKMDKQVKHKYKSVSEKWEYAYNKIK